MFDLEVIIRLVVLAVLVGIGIIIWPKLKNVSPQRPANGLRLGGNDVSPPNDAIPEIASNDRMAAGYPPAVAAKMTQADK